MRVEGQFVSDDAVALAPFSSLRKTDWATPAQVARTPNEWQMAKNDVDGVRWTSSKNRRSGTSHEGLPGSPASPERCRREMRVDGAGPPLPTTRRKRDAGERGTAAAAADVVADDANSGRLPVALLALDVREVQDGLDDGGVPEFG